MTKSLKKALSKANLPKLARKINDYPKNAREKAILELLEAISYELERIDNSYII